MTPKWVQWWSGVLLLAQALGVGCSDGHGSRIAPGGERDPRYRVEIETDSGPIAGVLALRVVPLEDWHLVPDSPAAFSVAGAGVSFARSSLGSDDAVYVGEESVEFRLPFQREVDGDAVVSGDLKFGICQTDDQRCVVIERDLEFVLRATSAELDAGSR